MAHQTHRHDGACSVSSDHKTILAEPPTNAVLSASFARRKKTVTQSAPKRAFIGIGWLLYQSSIQAHHSNPHASHSRTLSCDSDDKEINIKYFAATWFSSWGFSFCAARTWGAWQYNLKPSRVVTDSDIFDAAYDGDIQLIAKRLEDGQATIYDTDTYGWNLLHVGNQFRKMFHYESFFLRHYKITCSNVKQYAARGLQLLTCQWLLDQGVTGDVDYKG